MPTMDTVKALQKNSKVTFKNIDGSHFNATEISYLEKNLYRFPAENFNGKCENIKVFSANRLTSYLDQTKILVVKLLMMKKV